MSGNGAFVPRSDRHNARTPLLARDAIAALVVTTMVVGCARRPSVLSRATVPSGPPAAAAPAPAEGDTAVAVVVEERKIIAERPAPATFVENANVKPIYFDFDRYDIRPEDARTLEADAAWLKSNKVLILAEGQCDERCTDATWRLVIDAPGRR